ncbi:heterokaryon incompatibility protein-domain-containing protein, partial [Leptodontidium sp. MPI-SDFR-AT-0119]
FFTDKLNDCRRYHTECRQGDSTLPTRLLYIGSSDGNAIRLVESDEILSYRPLYAAVSHRWVRDPTWMLRTLNQNYKDHLQSISLVKCPGVLQDAVRVTRALGVDYLWMDTLCLIQDSSTDKAKEIGKMGDYYRNAYFTIAASSSKTTLVPFTNRRDPYYKPHLFPFGKNGNSAVHARRLGVEGFLAKRGWIWQESALSVRMLNFAPSELIWECRQEVESECGYEPKPFPSLGLAQKYLDIGEEPFKLWQDLVQTYSTRTFGDFTDFLPGISGLAKRIQDQTGSAYHAGMWKMDMVPSLLWEVTRGFDRVKEPRPTVPEPSVECKAPSWSWASVEGRIRTSDTDIRNSCRPAGYSPSLGGSGVDGSFSNMTPDIPEPEVEGLEQLTPNSSFGKVAGGLLIIKGRLIPVRLTYSRGRDGIWTYQLMLPGEHDSGIGFSPDTELEPFPRWSQAQNRTVRRTNEILTTGFSVTVHCLRIATWPGAPNQRLTDDGLVLGRSEDNNNYFKRIGYFSFENSSHFDYVLPQSVTIS